MRAEKLAINSQCTFQHNLEEALDAYAAAGFRCVEPHLNLVKDWLEDGHTVDEARSLFEERDLAVVASSQLEVMCFGSPDARGPLVWLMLSEIFPLEMRGFAIGISVFLLWTTNFFVGLFFPSLVAGIGISSTFFLFAAIGAAAFVFIYTMVPETRGKTLEQLEEQFCYKYGEAASGSPQAARVK